MRIGVPLLLGLLLLPALASPAASDALGPAPLDLLRVLDVASLQPKTTFEAFDPWTFALADLNGDGLVEIVTLNDNSRTYVMDPRRGAILAELETRHAGNRVNWIGQELNPVAIADLDGDLAWEIVVLNSGGYLTVLEFDGARSTRDAFAFRTLWRLFVHAPDFDPRFYDRHPWLRGERRWDPAMAHGNPYVARIDGEPWVFVQSDGYPGQFAFDSRGNLQWVDSRFDGHAGPWVGALPPYEGKTALFATDGGVVVAYDAATGRERWRFDARKHGAHPGSIAVPPLVVDLDGDGGSEIFVAARVAQPDPKDPRWMARQHASYFLLDAAGEVRWSASYPWGNPLMHMRAVPLDANGDDVLDLLVLDWNTIGHKPGDWERLGPANLFVADGRDGSVLWRTAVETPFSRHNVPVARFLPGEASMQALVAHRSGNRDGLALVDVRTGGMAAFVPLPEGWTATRGAALADVDADGYVDAVVPVARPAEDCRWRDGTTCREGALLVYRTHAREVDVVWDNNAFYNEDLDPDPRERRVPPPTPAGAAPAPPEGAFASPPTLDRPRGPPQDEGRRSPTLSLLAAAAAAVLGLGLVSRRVA